MKKTLLAAAALAGVVVLPAGSALASERAIATTDVNLRAGPSTDYPVVDVLVAGEELRVFGCLQTRSWCEVRFRGQRGWISANYIALTGGSYAGRHDFDPYSAPVVTFSIDNYWGSHYRSRNFYRDRDRFDGHRRPHRDPRRDHHDRRDYGDRDGRGDRGDYDRRRRPDDRADFDRRDDHRGDRYDGRGRHDGRPDDRGSQKRRYQVPGPGGIDPNAGPPRPVYRVD